MSGKQAGFTIVELVVVIILLGILAATALPRFIDIEGDAHQAAFEGVVGSLQTGIALFHAKAIATDADVNEVPGLAEGADDFSGLRANADRYPYGTVDNSTGTSTVTTSADCAAVFTRVQPNAPTVTAAAVAAGVAGAGSAGAGSDYVAVATAPSCTYWYTGQTTVSGEQILRMTYDSVTGLVTTDRIVLP